MPFITKKFTIDYPQNTLAFLIDELNFSRSEAQRLIARGRLSQYGNIIDDPAVTIEGEIELICFEPLSQGHEPVYVTNDFAVYDKPNGLRVHPYSRQSPYTLNDEIKHRFGNDANAVHRIDQETSGLVLVSLNKKSEPVLKRLFAERYISKRYLAMVKGHLDCPLDIQEPLLRPDHPNLSISMVVRVHPSGKHARTFITPIKYFPSLNATLVEASPLTGRTHQIRVHLFHVKHPIIGDPIYGQSEEDITRYLNKEVLREERVVKYGANRLLLHANSLEFEYDSTAYCITSKENFLVQCFEAMGISDGIDALLKS